MVAKPWKIYGPYDMDKSDPRRWQELFSETIHEKEDKLLAARGVYVIATKNTKSVRIKYVGMTNKSFGQEVCSQANVKKVWDEISESKTRTMRVWLIAKRKTKQVGFISDASIKQQAHHLEELLIMLAKGAGHALINKKKMVSSEGKAVVGLLGVKAGKGKPAKSASSLRQALKLL